jgi:hypothetical protein
MLGLKLLFFAIDGRTGSAVSNSGANHASRRQPNINPQITDKRRGCGHRGLYLSGWSHRPDGFRGSLQAQSGFLGRESGKHRADDSPWRPLISSAQVASKPWPHNQTPRPRRPWFYFPALRADVSALSQQVSGFPLDVAQQITMWQASTWVSDQLSSPPALIVVGPNMRRAVDLFQLLACGSRRALALTGINRAALVGLPTDLNLTLLIAQPDLSRNLYRKRRRPERDCARIGYAKR